MAPGNDTSSMGYLRGGVLPPFDGGCRRLAEVPNETSAVPSIHRRARAPGLPPVEA